MVTTTSGFKIVSFAQWTFVNTAQSAEALTKIQLEYICLSNKIYEEYILNLYLSTYVFHLQIRGSQPSLLN